MKNAFVFFLIAQFLNVQIQTSFATEAITSNSPEVQNSLNSARAHIAKKLSGKSEAAVTKIAYRLYKLDTKLRNKAVQNAEEKMVLTQEDANTIQELNDVQTSENLQVPQHNQQEIKKEKVIAHSDPILKALGSELQSNGSLSTVSFKEFKENLSKLPVKNSLERAPSGVATIILNIILTLLIVLAGLSLFYAGVLVLVLVIWGGTFVASWFVGLLVAGLISLVVLGIVAVWTQNELKLIKPTAHRC